MSTLLIILNVILLGALIGFFYYLARRFKRLEGERKEKKDQGILMLQNQLGEIRGDNIKIIQDVTRRLDKLDETNRQVVNFADQLQNLQDILKNPKQRGVLGEYFLESVLKNVLPPGSYQIQYKLGKDEKTDKDLIVDAAVFVKEKIIPIDAKFSLENYNRLASEHSSDKQKKLEKLFKQDLKNRIDETAKYIQPTKDTFDFAFMFIPSEAIYYDLLASQIGAVKISAQNLIEYAFKEKHVIVVSPTTFLAYLQMVLQGLKSFQIEKSAQEIRKNVEKLGRHIINYDSFLEKLGQNLGTTVNTYNSAYKEFQKIDKDVVKMAETGGKVQPLQIEKPKNG